MIFIHEISKFSTEESPPCSCPLCTSDKGSCVPFYEGLELSKEIGAAYLELHSLNDFNVGKYFGGVVSKIVMLSLDSYFL